MKEGDGCSIWNLFSQSDRVYSFQMYAHSQDTIINDLLGRHFTKKLQPELLSSSNTHKKKNQTKKKSASLPYLTGAHFWCISYCSYSLQMSLETPGDTCERLCHLHSLPPPKLKFWVCSSKKEKRKKNPNFLPFQKITCPS